MFRLHRLSRAARLALSTSVGTGLAGLLLAVPPALAQEQRIEITGSRIIRNDLLSNSPLYSIGLESMGQLGMQNFADMATQLPQFAPSFSLSRTQSTFSGVENSGVNGVNLRNLGSQRSLVLINGRRVPGGRTTSSGVDFNNIPTANIETIEVITGGASAIYGADAVAGVVNIITRKNFSGLQVGLEYGESNAGDNKNPSAHLMFGGRIGNKGRGLLTLEFDKQGQVSCRDREICSEDFAWNTPGTQLRGPAAYSGVGLGGRFFVGPNSFTRRDGSFTDANGALIPFNVQVDGYNRNADRDLAIPTRRILMAADVEYELGGSVRAFGEINYGSNSTDSKFEGHPFQSQQPGSLFGTLQATIPVTNPFIPAPLLAAINAFNADPANAANPITQLTWWQRFNNAGGARGANTDRQMIRSAFGLKGDLASLGGIGRDWRWELSQTYGRTTVNLNTEGLVSTSNLYYGLRVEADPANPGQFRCADPAARAQGCVPINPFADYTPAQQQALRVGSLAIGRGTLNNTVATISGALADLPAGTLRTAFGAEYRSSSGFLDRDVVVNNGLATGNQISDTDYSRTTTQEVFAEVLVPVLADLPGAQSLNFDGAFRRSETERETYNTWKVGGDWAPVDGLRLRAMQARAVRAPQPTELSGIGLTAGNINDPCTAARRNLNAVRAANCNADGVPANYAPPLVVEQGVTGLSGGNPDLKPEQATTLTFGLVWQPKQVRGFSLAIDRFKIDMEDVITTVSRQLAVDKCYDTVERLLCAAVTRGANPVLPGATWVLTGVNEQQQNVATLKVSGIDIDIRYALPIGGWGNLDLKLISTHYDHATLVPLAGSAEINLLGQAGGSTTDQGWIKHTASATAAWRMGAFNASWNLRYIGSADMAVGSTEAGFPRIPAHTYHNLRAGFYFDKESEFYVGVTNVMDKKPPTFATSTSGTQSLDTVPGYYDVFGRSFFAGVRAKF